MKIDQVQNAMSIIQIQIRTKLEPVLNLLNKAFHYLKPKTQENSLGANSAVYCAFILACF